MPACERLEIGKDRRPMAPILHHAGHGDVLRNGWSRVMPSADCLDTEGRPPGRDHSDAPSPLAGLEATRGKRKGGSRWTS